MDCSPRGCKESDITKQLSMHTQKIQNQRIEDTSDLIISVREDLEINSS